LSGVVLDRVDTVLNGAKLRRFVHLLHSTREGEPETKRENGQVHPRDQWTAIQGDALLGGRYVRTACRQREHHRQGRFPDLLPSTLTARLAPGVLPLGLPGHSIQTTTYVRNIYTYYVSYKLMLDGAEAQKKTREQVTREAAK
jgi:hypothetical protein